MACSLKVHCALSAAAPEPAVAPGYERQACFITGPARVLGQLEFFLHRLPAFAVLALLLDLGGGLLHQSEDVLCILLGAKPSAGIAGMTGDHAFPVHGDHLLDEGFGFQRVDIDEAAAKERADRDGVDQEDDL